MQQEHFDRLGILETPPLFNTFCSLLSPKKNFEGIATSNSYPETVGKSQDYLQSDIINTKSSIADSKSSTEIK